MPLVPPTCINFKLDSGFPSNFKKFLILDKKKEMQMSYDSNTFESLMDELYLDTRLNDLEKCVVLLQMLTYVGNDLYDEKSQRYKGQCDRKVSEQFLIDNSSFIEY